MSNKNDKSERPSKDGNRGEPPDLSHIHPIIKALVAEMPGPEVSWDSDQCVTWLRMMVLSFGLIYDNGWILRDIKISAPCR